MLRPSGVDAWDQQVQNVRRRGNKKDPGGGKEVEMTSGQLTLKSGSFSLDNSIVAIENDPEKKVKPQLTCLL